MAFLAEKIAFTKSVLPLLQHYQSENAADVQAALKEQMLKPAIEFLAVELHNLEGLPAIAGPIAPHSFEVFVDEELDREFALVSKAIGPFGCMARAFRSVTGCSLKIKGKGSWRNPEKEVRCRNAAGCEHLLKPLHFEVSCRDTAERAEARFRCAKLNISKLLHYNKLKGYDKIRRKEIFITELFKGKVNVDELLSTRGSLPSSSPPSATLSAVSSLSSTSAPLDVAWSPLLSTPSRAQHFPVLDALFSSSEQYFSLPFACPSSFLNSDFAIANDSNDCFINDLLSCSPPLKRNVDVHRLLNPFSEVWAPRPFEFLK